MSTGVVRSNDEIEAEFAARRANAANRREGYLDLEAEQDRDDIWDNIATDNPRASTGMDELFSDAQRRSAQRFQAQHDHLNFLDNLLLPQYVALPKQLSGVLLDAPHRVVHVLHATLVLRHQRTVEKLVQHGK